MTMNWPALLTLTLRDPGSAARQVLLTPMSRGEIWMAVLAVAATSTVLSALGAMLSPPPPDAQPFPQFTPFAFFVLVSGSLVLSAHILTWTGRMFGGSGSLDGLTKLLVWLQCVGVVLNLVSLALLPFPIGIQAMYQLVVIGLTLWMLAHFVREGHGFADMGTAVVILVIGLLGFGLALALILTMAMPELAGAV